MVCPGREMSHAEGFALWQRQAEGKACCDYSFHMGVTHFDDRITGPTPRDRGGRGGQLQGLPGLQGGPRRRRRGALADAHARQGTRRDRHGPLRKRDAVNAAPGEAPGRRPHRPGGPPRQPPAGGRGRGRAPPLRRSPALTGATVYIVHLSCREALADGDRRPGAGRQGVGRDADPIPPARQDLGRAARLRGGQVRDVAPACETPPTRPCSGTAWPAA